VADPLSEGRLHEVERERVVCHVDMDCFYAACERLREPALAGKPLVVGMGYEPGDEVGAVATASYEAREFGVESAMPIQEALETLPRKRDAATDPERDVEEAGFYRPVDMGYYKEVSREVRAILSDAIEGNGPDEGEDGVVREVSIDEAYLDVTGVGWSAAAAFARDLRERIDAAVGVTASVGVAPDMSTAKVASDYDKPDGLTVVEPGDVRAFLDPLPVEELHGVGPVTAEALHDLGIETAADVAEADPADLTDRFGGRGRELYERARGRDDREVTPVGKPKSLSSENALPPTGDTERKRDLVASLADEVAGRARAEGALYKTIGIKVVTPPFDVNTRARSLPGPVDDPDLIEEVALDLLREFADDRVRKLGVRVSNLDFSEADQASLDGWAADAVEADTHGDGSGSADPDRDADPPRRGQRSLGEFE
jgi:DNA polymerase IV (DinB-like DNA polymerase)